jgi:hypothetical protein
MDNERRSLIRKIYLSAIADSAERIRELADRIEGAKHFDEIPDVEQDFSNKSALTLEQGGLVTSWPGIESLSDVESELQSIIGTLSASFNW